jgi:hypothetical protein
MRKLQIYWDMDGVLADFDSAKRRVLAGEEIHHTNDNAHALTPEGRAQKRKVAGIIEEDPYTFFRSLLPFNEMLRLVNRTAETHGRFSILTATPGRLSVRGREEARRGKRDWLSAHLPVHSDLWFDPTGERESKGAYVGRYNRDRIQVLIDDRASNCKEWEAAGGTAILHTSLEDTAERLESLQTARLISC